MKPSKIFNQLMMMLASAFLCLVNVHAGDTTEQTERIRNIIDELRCPTCQGLSVKDSDAGFSVNIRNKAVEMVREGFSDDEIRAFFVERYGEWILRAPPMVGFNLILWLLPGAGLLFGFWYISKRTREWVEAENKSKDEELEPLTLEEEKKIEKDMKRFEEA